MILNSKVEFIVTGQGLTVLAVVQIGYFSRHPSPFGGSDPFCDVIH